jgi:phosphate transport system protein
MRDAFHQEIDEITHTLVEMTNLVKRAMNNATQALIESNLQLAEDVIRQDEVVDNMQHELDARTMLVLAKQQPVASDLRTLVTSLRMSADLERIGDMAHHIANLSRMHHPNKVVPQELQDDVRSMGKVASDLINKVAKILVSKDVEEAKQVEIDDDEMDKLHRKLIKTLTSKDWPHDTESAIDMTLLGRYYERAADHAVSISRRIIYLVTGKYSVTD